MNSKIATIKFHLPILTGTRRDRIASTHGSQINATSTEDLASHPKDKTSEPQRKDDMTEDQQRVRKFLAEGRISENEAERLLHALEANRNEEQSQRVAVEEHPEVLDRLGGSWAEEIDEDVRQRIAAALDVDEAGSTGDDSFDVGANPRLRVRGLNGRVRIVAGDAGTIRVRVTLKNRHAVEYRCVQDGDLVNVEVLPVKGSGGLLSGFFGQRRGADIDVTVPVTTSVDLASSNGPVEVRGTEGDGTLQTSNAPIRIERFKGGLEARTSNGRIKVDRFQGNAELATSNGRISIDDGIGQFDVKTSNGSISFQGKLDPLSSNRLITSNGGIKISLIGDPDVKVEASTVNGRVRCELSGFSASVDTGRKIEGAVRDGETELVARTVNGSVTIA